MADPELTPRNSLSQAGSPSPADFWRSKPGWCQPWTILLTGSGLVGGSWVLLHRWWITLPLTVAVLAWWGLFLVVVPRTPAAPEP